jgi:hypothetical protein
MPIALLAMLLVPPLSAEDDFADQLAQIQKAYAKASREVRSDIQDVETNITKKRALLSKRMQGLSVDFMGQYQALADKHATTPQAFEALAIICQLGARSRNSRDAQVLVTKAKDQLLADHLGEKRFVRVVGHWSGDDKMLAKIGEESTSRDVQGLALYYQMLAAKGRDLTEKNVTLVKPMMKRLSDEFGDVRLVYSSGRDRGSLAELVANELFAFENLRIGKTAPDIDGEDLDGVNFKLSDYRGKVVVIDFWGDW